MQDINPMFALPNEFGEYYMIHSLHKTFAL